MTGDPGETERWLRGLRRGEPDALAALLDFYRSRLRQMLRARMDRQLSARVDPSDVIREVYLGAKRQVRTYLRDGQVAFYVWLRGLAVQRLSNVRREHVGAKCRTVWREVPLPAESSVMLAEKLLAGDPSPSRAALRKELRHRVQHALDELPPDDREVILMPRSPGGLEGIAVCGRVGPEAARAVQERSPGRRLVGPSQHRPRLRGRLRAGCALFCDAIHRRADACRGGCPVVRGQRSGIRGQGKR